MKYRFARKIFGQEGGKAGILSFFYVFGLKQEGNLFRPQGSIGYFSDLEGRKEKSPRSGEKFSVVF